MPKRKRYVQHKQQYIPGDYCFEAVYRILYLGLIFREGLRKIRKRVAAEIRASFALNKTFNSRIQTKQFKVCNYYVSQPNLILNGKHLSNQIHYSNTIQKLHNDQHHERSIM